MDDIEKLSCKELMDMSDIDNSGNEEQKEIEEKPKKKTRRRREIDMIKLSDDDDDSDDDGSRKKSVNRLSPGRNSPASHREPRTCVLKASQKRRPLSRLLEQLLRNLEKRDPNQFFAWPVNDNFAPNYSNIIKRPMDFSTIKQKIDDNEYRSLNCFISDFKLMCNNAMKYNKPGTVYHKAARRLLHQGLKQLTPHKLRPLGNILTYMYEIPIRELGFDIGKMDVHKVLKRTSPLKSGWEAEAVSDGGERGDRVKLQMEHAREQHRRKLAKKAFPRTDRSGRTTLCLAASLADPGELTLGQYVGRLTHGSSTLHTLREDRRNLVKGVKPLNYGPFSSYAPSYDSTFATLTKEESHLLYHTLASETGQGEEHLLRFAADSPWSIIYDMEAMFPERTPADAEVDLGYQEDPSSCEVDVDQLRSLSELGVDVEFLDTLTLALDPPEREKDPTLRPALQQSAALLRDLERAQRLRLSSGVGTASLAERATAAATARSLVSLASRAAPGDLVPPAAVRAAMGVTLEHLDTPVSVDELSELEAVDPRDVSDPDSRSSHDCK